MGYFPNGTSNDIYRQRYCDTCYHDIKGDCPIVLLHLVHNYDECNKPTSFLHALIPRDKETGENKMCSLYVPRNAVRPVPTTEQEKP